MTDHHDPDSAGRADRPRLRGRLHLVAAGLAAAAAPVLVLSAPTTALRWAVGVFVFGILAMLATSAAYHVVDWAPTMVAAMRRADHSTIFLAIAGTYTPLLVVALAGGVRRWMLVGVWVGAVAGIAVNQLGHRAPRWVRTLPYLALGWVAVVLLPSLWRLSPTVLWLVAAGGLAYTIGAVVYLVRRPDPWPTWFGHHEVFHALTIAALALHWWAVHVAVTLPT